MSTHPSAAPDALLSLTGISASIGPHRPLVDVNLALRRGTTLGVVGESGSGKSLSLRIALGMLDRIGGHVDTGRVTFDGRDLLTAAPEDWLRLRGREIAFVPQNSAALLNPVRRIGSQLREAVRRFEPGADATARSLELLEAVHIARPQSVLRQYPHEISGGTVQRVMIALAVAGRPRVLLADEPTTALDVTVQKAVLALLAELQRELEMSMVFVSHDLEVVEAVADDIAVMYRGETIETGSAEQVLGSPQHSYTRDLIDAQPGKALVVRRPVERDGRP